LLLCLFAALHGRELPAYIAGYAQADRFSTATLVAVTLPNLSLFGLDVLHFFHITPAGGLAPSLQPPTALFDPNAAGRWFSFIPQAWTLGLELEFYLLAPLLVRWRSRGLVLLFAASTAGRVLFYHWGYTTDPWSDRFFPFEIALFVAGLLAYRGYRWLTESAAAERVNLLTTIGRIGVAAIVVAILTFANVLHLPDFAALGHGPAANWLLIASVTIVLPCIFVATRRSRVDNLIGQYSYPVYISHFVFIGFFGERLRLFGAGYGLNVVLLSIALSGLLLYASRGVERRRQRGAALAMQV
jgi:peptidoglycan/LPS O-acetylase OafA/YrhL